MVVIIAVTAFKLPSKTNYSLKSITTFDASYFSYIGPSNPFSFEDYEDPSNYVALSIEQNPLGVCEVGNDALCVIVCERYWDGVEWKPDFSDTSFGSTRNQLFNYWMYGLQGSLIYLKAL